MERLAEETVLEIPRGDGQEEERRADMVAGNKPTAFVRNIDMPRGGHSRRTDDDDGDFPFLFGSRLNSMKDRPDLWDGTSLENPRDYVKRQATVRGLTVSKSVPTRRRDFRLLHPAID
jgi:hypothetical protein